ncbi:YheT family hydrolase [Acinetobacter venetianus]|uniref:YheT family hydrolase n=1 Tax=Acinetobacter venetianus TaxID=52133 RepID=UPI001023EE7A|nr:alpha/beta fold hydrolase [Acinetobacter venetianus]RZG80414.1 alpha/beta hydrolase [Acinetobacter venetianus]
MGISALNKIKVLGSELFDAVVGAEQPKMYYDPNGKIKNTLEKLPQLREKYRPTPWLSNTHLHLLYFDVIRKKTIKLEYDRVDQLTMQDGGITAIAWYGYDLPAETPTVVIMHTITGTPESMRELVKDLHEYTGWRIALCLRRGHAGLPMPVPRISLFGSTSDLREQLLHIQSLFPQTELYAVGSSAGTGLLVRYLGEQGSDTPFKAAFAMCPGYNTEIGFKNVHPFYSKMMTKKLFKYFIQPYQDMWNQVSSIEKVLATTNLEEFEKVYFEMAGYQDYQSYCQAINPIYVFENIKIPLMILNAEDDPVCSIKNLEPYKDAIQKMDNIAVVTTKKGSHCGFYEGWKGTSWAAKLISNYFIVDHKQ